MKLKGFVFWIVIGTSYCGKHENNFEKGSRRSLSLYTNSDLKSLESRFHLLESMYKDSKAMPDKSSIGLEVNYLKEKIHSIKNQIPNFDENALNSKYDVMQRALNDYLDTQDTTLGVHESYKKERQDILLPFPNFTQPIDEDVLLERDRIFAEFGDLYINETRRSDGELEAEESELKMPWAGHWYPISKDTLYKKGGPLEKAQKLLKNRGITTDFVTIEAEKYKHTVISGGDGLCTAWAMASLRFPEPKKTKRVDGIDFSIADQKALITYSHSNFPFIQYGLKFDGTARSDGIYQSLHPDALQLITDEMIDHRKQPFVMDDTAGTSIWHKPVFGYIRKIEKDPKYDYLYHVKGWLYAIDQRSEESDKLTDKVYDRLEYPVSYNLYVDKTVQKNGKFKVIAGQWWGHSFQRHPANIKVPVSTAGLKSHNLEFNKYIDVLKTSVLDH